MGGDAETNVEEEATATSLEGQDTDIENMSLEDFEASLSDDSATDQDADDETDTDDLDDADIDAATDDANDESDTDTADADTDTDDDDVDTSETDDADDSTSDDADDDADKDETETEVDDVDAATQLKELLAPFRANGRDIQVKDVAEARQLMQMGANYNKKMHGLKPSLKLVKMLDNNGLLDESKLTYLIDLNKKDPEAIKKFVKDSGINPLDLDMEKEPEYKPGTYTVDDSEFALDETLDDIRDTDSFKQTMDIVSNKWDAPSKKALVDSPDVIKTINEHVKLGYYDQISTAVEHERMLGRLIGMSDLVAYKTVGDAINAAGGFDTPADKSDNTSEKPVTNDESQKDTKRKSKKRAASSNKRVAKKTKKTIDDDFNPLNASDEDFEKLASSDYM